MTLTQQLLWGSVYLCGCLILQTIILVWCSSILKRHQQTKPRFAALFRGKIILISLAFILFSHTVQVWIWAAALIFAGAMADWNTSIYFSLVTYAALGYGDIVLGPGLRIFAAFASVNGLLGFGISTAFLVAIVGQVVWTLDTDAHDPQDSQQR